MSIKVQGDFGNKLENQAEHLQKSFYRIFALVIIVPITMQ